MSTELPQTPSIKFILAYSKLLAKKNGDNHVGPAHLKTALAHYENKMAAEKKDFTLSELLLGLGSAIADDTPETGHPYQAEDGGNVKDVSMSLCQVLSTLFCPESSERTLRDLASTESERAQLKIMGYLWKSADDRVSPFYTHTRVFYNRIVDDNAKR